MARVNLRRICDKQEWRCYWCGEPMVWVARYDAGDEATKEHLVPMSRGGRDNYGNIVAAHKRCNHRRGRLSVERFREIMEAEKLSRNET